MCCDGVVVEGTGTVFQYMLYQRRLSSSRMSFNPKHASASVDVDAVPPLLKLGGVEEPVAGLSMGQSYVLPAGLHVTETEGL